MNLFKSLQSFFTDSKKPPDEPLLNEVERQHLRNMLDSKGFPVFLKLLDREVHLQGENLLNPGLTSEQATYVRGLLAGMRKVPLIVRKHLQQGEDFDAYRRRAELAAEDRARRQRLTLFGTPFWGG